MEENKIVIYKDKNNSIQLEVKLDGDMVWLTRQQIATLFGRDYKTISKHINNALKEELGHAIGKEFRSVVSVNDKGFAASLQKLTGMSDKGGSAINGENQ